MPACRWRSTASTSTRRFHPQFDEWVRERHHHRRLVEEVNGEYVAQWEGDNAEGLKGAYDPDIRDKELDADGIAGEVIFADGDSVTGQESPPFGAGLSAGMITDPELAFAGARAHNRWLVEFCATNPARRAGRGAGPDHPRRRAVGRARSSRSPASPASRGS